MNYRPYCVELLTDYYSWKCSHVPLLCGTFNCNMKCSSTGHIPVPPHVKACQLNYCLCLCLSVCVCVCVYACMLISFTCCQVNIFQICRCIFSCQNFHPHLFELLKLNTSSAVCFLHHKRALLALFLRPIIVLKSRSKTKGVLFWKCIFTEYTQKKKNIWAKFICPYVIIVIHFELKNLFKPAKVVWTFLGWELRVRTWEMFKS